MFKIAITGKSNSGKNTVGKLLTRSLIGNSWEKQHAYFIAFADPLKKIAKLAFPKMPRKWLYGPSKFRSEIIPNAFKDGIPLTVRQLLIDLGNDFGRKYQPDLWIRNFDNTFEKLLKKNAWAIVVTDCRFRNEFNHLKSLDFYQIRLLRDSATKINDVSETNQDGIHNDEYDYVIHNNGTLQNLKDEVSKIVLQLSA